MRHSRYDVKTNSRRQITVSADTLLVTAATRLPSSETANQSCCSSHNAASETTGSVTSGRFGIGGDWVGPACGRPVNVSAARYCATPSAMMLIATPDTMWSTPKVTVAIACSRPPSAPQNTPSATAPHGPQT